MILFRMKKDYCCRARSWAAKMLAIFVVPSCLILPFKSDSVPNVNGSLGSVVASADKEFDGVKLTIAAGGLLDPPWNILQPGAIDPSGAGI